MARHAHRVEFINKLETRLVAEVIDAGNIEEIIEREVVAAEFRNLVKIFAADQEGEFVGKFRSSLDLRTEELFDGREQRLAGHAVASSYSFSSSRFCARKDCSPEI